MRSRFAGAVAGLYMAIGRGAGVVMSDMATPPDVTVSDATMPSVISMTGPGTVRERSGYGTLLPGAGLQILQEDLRTSCIKFT